MIREQKLERSRTESGRLDGEQLAKGQQKVTEQTRDLSKRMGNNKDGKDSKADPKGQNKDNKGKPEGKQDPKDNKGDPKGDQKPKDGKGDPKDNKPERSQGR